MKVFSFLIFYIGLIGLGTTLIAATCKPEEMGRYHGTVSYTVSYSIPQMEGQMEGLTFKQTNDVSICLEQKERGRKFWEGIWMGTMREQLRFDAQQELFDKYLNRPGDPCRKKGSYRADVIQSKLELHLKADGSGRLSPQSMARLKHEKDLTGEAEVKTGCPSPIPSPGRKIPVKKEQAGHEGEVGIELVSQERDYIKIRLKGVLPFEGMIYEGVKFDVTNPAVITLRKN